METDNEPMPSIHSPMPPGFGLKGNLGISYAIDAHVHFFNATDIQASGYLTGPIANSMNEEYLPIIRAMAPIVDMLAHIPSLSAKFEYKVLEKFIGKIWKKSREDSDAALLKQVVRHETGIVEKLYKALNDPDSEPALAFQTAVSDLISGKSSIRSYLKAAPLKEIPKAFIQDALWGPGIRYSQEGVLIQKEWLQMSDEELNIAGILYFAARMLSLRYMNLFRYRQAYSSDGNSFGINACFGALVDFDYFLGKKPICSCLHDQVLLNKALAQLFKGYYFPMVGYNPWTDIEESEKSFKLIEEAVQAHGFIGIKIYPSIGYFPYGNTGPDFCAKQPNQPADRHQMDRNLRKMYRLAQDLKIPVMGHSGPGMGQTLCSGKYGDHQGWRKLAALLENDVLSTRIIFGHLGFGSYQEFITLMEDYPDLGLYGDLGYWNHLTGELGEWHARKLVTRITTSFPGRDEKIYARVMYGTDWLMLAKEKKEAWQAYPQQLFSNISAAFNGDEKERLKFLNAIAYKNALRIFNMDFGDDGILKKL